MKKQLISLLALFLILGLAGCAAPNAGGTEDYIGVEAAKNIALGLAQLSGGEITASSTQLDEKNGISYYKVNFSADGQNYEYAIDALTGAVIESSSPQAGQGDDTAGGSESTNSGNTNSGSNSGTNSNSGSSNSGSGKITESQAVQIALEHAGVKESDATYLQSKTDYDDGIAIYEVEFYVSSTGMEYDYEIEISSGKILSFDHDAEGYVSGQGSSQSGTAKTESEIQEIALARVPGATANDIRLKVDRDDGRLLYEGTIIYNNMKYEFEIDAYSGAFLEWDAESVFD